MNYYVVLLSLSNLHVYVYYCFDVYICVLR